MLPALIDLKFDFEAPNIQIAVLCLTSKSLVN